MTVVCTQRPDIPCSWVDDNFENKFCDSFTSRPLNAAFLPSRPSVLALFVIAPLGYKDVNHHRYATCNKGM